jgi:hypothetical protein
MIRILSGELMIKSWQYMSHSNSLGTSGYREAFLIYYSLLFMMHHTKVWEIKSLATIKYKGIIKMVLITWVTQSKLLFLNIKIFPTVEKMCDAYQTIGQSIGNSILYMYALLGSAALSKIGEHRCCSLQMNFCEIFS